MEGSKGFPLDEKKCVTFLLKEEERVGPGGVLMVKGEEWAYVMLREDLMPERVLQDMEMKMEEDCGKSFFIVLIEKKECRVYTYARERALLRLAEWSDEQRYGEGEAGGEGGETTRRDGDGDVEGST